MLEVDCLFLLDLFILAGELGGLEEVEERGAFLCLGQSAGLPLLCLLLFKHLHCHILARLPLDGGSFRFFQYLFIFKDVCLGQNGVFEELIGSESELETEAEALGNQDTAHILQVLEHFIIFLSEEIVQSVVVLENTKPKSRNTDFALLLSLLFISFLLVVIFTIFIFGLLFSFHVPNLSQEILHALHLLLSGLLLANDDVLSLVKEGLKLGLVLHFKFTDILCQFIFDSFNIKLNSPQTRNPSLHRVGQTLDICTQAGRHAVELLPHLLESFRRGKGSAFSHD
mmetsp:Transcript_30469/g.78973  ORF Transcript_30469/g.78973 Transcript_30469/m.78973 type:complete len:284 (+) Transcript_30469:3493-4344(+)